MDIPSVSIVTPSYNQGEYIEDTLRSVANQSYANIEHVVVDGGSTDDTVQLLEQYENEYDLRWVSEPDEGQADAVNKGFEMATGDIVGWLNSDDVYFSTDAISAIVAEFILHPESDVIYGDDVFMYSDGTVHRARKLYDWSYDRMRYWGWWGWTPASETTFYRKQVVNNNPLDTDLHYVMDYEYFLRLGTEYEFHHIEKVLAGKRKHADIKSANKQCVATESREAMRALGQEFEWTEKPILWFALVHIQLQWLVGFLLLAQIDFDKVAFNGGSQNWLAYLRTQPSSIKKFLDR